ncbi:NAD(P)-dependent oxidoreductase [Candidatus Poribacteria bacterium]|nr:NAD(P)-dependent oxidoreductase [Candidatus Poribacteria bacterium]
MERVLVTGGLGLIGSHLVEQLVRFDYEVTIVDNMSSFDSPNRHAHEEALQWRISTLCKDTPVVSLDVRHVHELAQLFYTVKPDTIIHLAGTPQIRFANQHPKDAVSSIVDGTFNLLELARTEPKPPRIVFISSSTVYGNFIHNSAREHHPTNPIDVYAAAKLAGEALVRGFGNRFSIPFTIVRPSAVYGPSDVNGRVVQTFLERAMSGLELELRGEDSRLDFTYVADAATGIRLAAASDQAVGETFNITYGQGRTLGELASIIRTLIPSTTIRKAQRDSTLPIRGTLDISKAQRVLSYKPLFSLEDGIAKYYHSKSAHRI